MAHDKGPDRLIPTPKVLNRQTQPGVREGQHVLNEAGAREVGARGQA